MMVELKLPWLKSVIPCGIISVALLEVQTYLSSRAPYWSLSTVCIWVCEQRLNRIIEVSKQSHFAYSHLNLLNRNQC
jgi:hypothetical protein